MKNISMKFSYLVTFDGTLIQEANTSAQFDWHSINAFSHTALCNS